MKDGKFETQAEIFQALADGKKLTKKKWSKGVFIQLVDGMITDEGGDYCSDINFSVSEDFLIYEEPKPKKKVTLYRYTYEYSGNILESNFISKGWGDYKSRGDKLLLTESKEIEVDNV